MIRTITDKEEINMVNNQIEMKEELLILMICNQSLMIILMKVQFLEEEENINKIQIQIVFKEVRDLVKN
jgi:hypothetical protein